MKILLTLLCTIVILAFFGLIYLSLPTFYITIPYPFLHIKDKATLINCLVGIGTFAAFLAAYASLAYQRKKDQHEREDDRSKFYLNQAISNFEKAEKLISIRPSPIKWNLVAYLLLTNHNDIMPHITLNTHQYIYLTSSIKAYYIICDSIENNNEKNSSISKKISMKSLHAIYRFILKSNWAFYNPSNLMPPEVYNHSYFKDKIEDNAPLSNEEKHWGERMISHEVQNKIEHALSILLSWINER
ncbi:MAG: hypothetical protein ABSF18_03315 [Gammaproteobacteria bacterium]|jgi:hypothetical protein